MNAEFNETEYEKAQKEVFNDYQNKLEQESGKNYVLVKDGIVNVEKWKEQKVRPLVILKEGYHDYNDNLTVFKIENEKNEKRVASNVILWDEVKYMTQGDGCAEIISGKGWRTWKRLAQWSDYIFNNENVIAKNDYTWNCEPLQKIAIINIKKYDGETTSKDKQLEYHAKNYSSLIWQQIEVINPTVIICGYTCYLLDMISEKEKTCKIRNGKHNYYVYFDNPLGIPVIDFWHPACIENDQKLLNKFMCSFDCYCDKMRGKTDTEIIEDENYCRE